MKHISILLFLLTFSQAFGIFSPININTAENDDCVVMILHDKQKIEVVITSSDNAFTYYYLCDDNTQSERAVRNSKIKEIVSIPKQEKSNTIICEKLILKNTETLLVEVTRKDSTFIYFHLCGKSNLAERKLRLSFIEAQTRVMVDPEDKDLSTSNIVIKKDSPQGKKLAQRKGIWAFVTGFFIPSIIGLIGNGGIPRRYLSISAIVAIIVSLFFLISEIDERLKAMVLGLSLLGALLGILIIPLFLAIIFL